VLVSKAFADLELANPRPFLNSRILESVAEGRPVALSREQIRKANSTDGLDAVVLYGSWREDLLTPDDVSVVCTLLATRYVQVRLGYRLNRLFMEVVNKEIGVCLAMRTWREVRRFETPDASRSLLVMTREDSFRSPSLSQQSAVSLSRARIAASGCRSRASAGGARRPHRRRVSL